MPREPDYQRVRADIRRRIAAGEWPDDRLPTQRALADEYGVSLQPIKQALLYLEEVDRLIETHQGKGTFIVRRQLPSEESPEG